MALLAVTRPALAVAQKADLQLFGDVLLPERALEATESSAAAPEVFGDSRALLGSALHNVVNLEGVMTALRVPFEPKTFLLHMPPAAAMILKAAGIDLVTLANNHAMDYGWRGLADTIHALDHAELMHTGAGGNRTAAITPVLLPVRGRLVCLLAFSRTLPADFWATDTRPGTAYADEQVVTAAISACAASGYYTVVAFHWGQEMVDHPLPYQIALAHRAIDAGARLVVGHHPHVLQPLEVYNGRPIFYSLGNYAFGSEPSRTQEGMAVRVMLPPPGEAGSGHIEIVPLMVRNTFVHFKPRPLQEGESNPAARHIPKSAPCAWRAQALAWSCEF